MDSISGGSIPTDGVVKLTIDSDKVGYIKFPDGSLAETTLGVIDTIWGGDAGSITYYVPKSTNSSIQITDSDLSGNINYLGVEGLVISRNPLLISISANNAFTIDTNGNSELISISANKAWNSNIGNCDKLELVNFPEATFFNAVGSALLNDITLAKGETLFLAPCPSLLNLVAPKGKLILASSCALTAKSIGDILYSAYVDNRANVNFDFSGGTNANEEEGIEPYLLATYGIGVSTIYSLLVTDLGGTFLVNHV